MLTFRTVLLTVLISTMTYSQTAPIKVSPQAKAIHDSAIVIDTHADTPQRFLDEKFDLATDTPVKEGQMDFGKIRQGNLGAEFWSIWVNPEADVLTPSGGSRATPDNYAKRAFDLIDSVYQQAARHPDRTVMAFSADDIINAHENRKFASLMGIEGGHAIENDLHLLHDFYRLGVRYMTLTWSNSTNWAVSSGNVQTPGVTPPKGLTNFGRDVVREMNRLGMMVDVSHVSDQTFWDTIAVTKAPIIASHSSARALTNHPRNMTDDMLRAMAKNGGVVQVNFFPAFIDETYRKAYAAESKERDAALAALQTKLKDADPATRYRQLDNAQKEWAAKVPRPPLKSLIDHIDHIARVAGIDHVGLGSDFDGVPVLPQEIDSVADLPKITQALLDRGYTKDQLDKILGGNLLRVFRQVEQVSKQMNAAKAVKASMQ